MRSSTRLIVNTGAQYARTIINLILSLYSTRLILLALGIDDYGIFTLIAGVVSMLAFMTNAMVTTTQRFMSYHQTKSNLATQQIIFGNSVLMHLIFSIGVLILLEIAGIFLFNNFLNIPHDRIFASKIVYQCTICMVISSFITAPYKALIISHENLIYVSIIDVLDGVLKVIVAYTLLHLNSDKLILYGLMMLGIYWVNLIAFALYDSRNYNECVFPRFKYINKEYIKSMSSFVGWQLYSTGCIVGRTQGTAIILNKFFNTAINAAFGIALQVSGAISFLSSSLMLAINPQIVKAEGAGNRERMLVLAATASKFSFLLLAMVAVPIFIYISPLIRIWLGEIPEYAPLFCRVIILTALVDQITLGLGTANSAIGDIRNYSLSVNTIKIFTVPVMIILFILKYPLSSVIWSYAIIELICALTRIPFLKQTGGLVISDYIRKVFLKIPLPLCFIIIAYLLTLYIPFNFWIIFLIGIAISGVYGFVVYRFSLEVSEKKLVIEIFNRILHRHN